MKLFREIILFLALLTGFLLPMTGCSVTAPSEKAEMNQELREMKDSLGRIVRVPTKVERVAVANAYNAELITAIGAADKIIGVDYNIYQDQEGFQRRFTKEEVIGKDQRNINYEKVIELNPQVLILTGNGTWEEAEEKLTPFGIATFVCDAYYTDRFFDNASMLGALLGKERDAGELTEYFKMELEYVEKQLEGVPRHSVYFEYRTEGNSTIPGDYFYEMVNLAHGDNIFKDAMNKQVNVEEVVHRNPEYIVKVSDAQTYSSYIPPTSEDMERIHEELASRPGWDEIDAVKNGHILLLSHYVHGGAAKLVGTMYIAKFLYPEYLPDLHPENVFKTWVTKFQGLSYIPGHTYPACPLEDEMI